MYVVDSLLMVTPCKACVYPHINLYVSCRLFMGKLMYIVYVGEMLLSDESDLPFVS